LYRASRFVRRHRLLTAAIASVVLVLAVASLVSLRYAFVAGQARAEADQRAQESRAVSAFLERMLASADPELSAGHKLTVDDVVEQAEGDLERLDAEPGVQRGFATTLARTRRALGDYDVDMAPNRRALDLAERHAAGEAQRGPLLHQRASLFADLGQFDEAMAALEKTRAEWPQASLSDRLAMDLSSARI